MSLFRPKSSVATRSPRRLGRRLAAGLLAIGATATGTGLLTASPANAVPIRGDTPWSVLLCKVSDHREEPQNATFFANFLTHTGVGLGGAADYFANQSGNRVSLRGSTVRGWYTMPFTHATQMTKSRWQRTQDCVDAAARGGYTVPSNHRIAVIYNFSADSGSAGGRVILDQGAWRMRFASHEMLHGYGLGHSFSDDTSYQNAPWSAPGEYDNQWDQMSAENVFSFNTARFGLSGVGLGGYFRDKLGWLPMNDIVTFGANGVRSGTVTLESLDGANGSLPRLIRIPFEPGDLNRYYTVELRRPLGWSAGIPAPLVLINEVKNGTPYLLRNRGGARTPVQTLRANGVSIDVVGTSGNNATVRITTPMVDRCVMGYVWREARPGDLVCVTGAVRTQTRNDNAVKTSRWVNGPYGPHTCIQGYVWREAFPGDDVCVTGAVRSQAAADNAAAASRRNPARFAYGPNSCKPGYVWRQVDLSDYVCVTGAVRSQAWADNAVKTSRWVNGPYGPHTCIQGYVWREAFPGDDVCVTGANRSQARADNLAAPSRVANP